TCRRGRRARAGWPGGQSRPRRPAAAEGATGAVFAAVGGGRRRAAGATVHPQQRATTAGLRNRDQTVARLCRSGRANRRTLGAAGTVKPGTAIAVRLAELPGVIGPLLPFYGPQGSRHVLDSLQPKLPDCSGPWAVGEDRGMATDHRGKGRRGRAEAPPKRVPRKIYERELLRLQAELAKMQEWVRAEGARLVIVFEGRDGAGKGST